MKRVVILQPSYLPWIGYFDQINKADVFIFFDDVQFTRRDWRNRNRIKMQSGQADFITIPVQSKGNYLANIDQIHIDNQQEWAKKHLMMFLHNYKRAPFFSPVQERLQSVLTKRYELLADLTIDLIKNIAEYVGIANTTFLTSSKIPVSYQDSTDHLIQLCKAVGATHYLTGDSAKNYLDENRFTYNNLILEYQNYVHPVYPQLWGQFLSHLSIVDLLFNVGHHALDVITPSNVFGIKEDTLPHQ